jgi:hypothetical protein
MDVGPDLVARMLQSATADMTSPEPPNPDLQRAVPGALDKPDTQGGNPPMLWTKAVV